MVPDKKKIVRYLSLRADYLASAAAIVFFALFVTKQHQLANYFPAVIFDLNFLLPLICTIRIMAKADLQNCLLASKYRILVFVISVAITHLLFLNIQESIIILAKFFIFTLLVFSWSNNLRLFLGIAADTVCTSVFILIFLAEYGISNDRMILQEAWTKNSGGFVNVNLAPIFLFSSLIIHLLTNQQRKFLYLSAAHVFLFWFLDIFSRTTLIANAFLFIGCVLKSNWYFYLVTIFAALSSSLLCLFFFFPEIPELLASTHFGGKINGAISGRFYQYRSISWSPTFDDKIFGFGHIDSVFPEGLVLTGPVLILFLFLHFTGRLKEFPGFYMQHFILNVVLIFGLAEGFLQRTMTITLLVFSFLILNPKGFRHSDKGGEDAL